MSDHTSENVSAADAELVSTLLKDPNNRVFGRTVVPVVLPNKPKKKPVGDVLFEYAEHGFIGDAITLTLAGGKEVPASDHKLNLSNGLTLTYGQINGLAGDFYGTYQPISDGTNDQDRSTRFVAAFNTLAEGGFRQPAEALAILAVLQQEVDEVNKALGKGEDPSKAYATAISDATVALEAITVTRTDIPGYVGMSQINWDHFGDDARIAYNAGHATALQKAVSGDLEGAYAMNAFADHFLEDSFSSGHLRTPRRVLHSSWNPSADLCAKYMHDEDNYFGLSVKNPKGESWVIYGDKRALDHVDEENKNRCIAAVQASASEIYNAYQSKQAPSPDKYQAWTHAPTLDSARGPQTLAPLFTFKDERRSDITNRRSWTFTSSWWYATTVALIVASGLWPPTGTL